MVTSFCSQHLQNKMILLQLLGCATLTTWECGGGAKRECIYVLILEAFYYSQIGCRVAKAAKKIIILLTEKYSKFWQKREQQQSV